MKIGATAALLAARERWRSLWGGLGRRDRWMVGLLALFLLGAVYYQWVLEPMEANWRQGRKRMQQQQQRLVKLQEKVQQAAQVKETQARLQAEFDTLAARVTAPAAGQPQATILAGISKAAQSSQIRLSALRPVSASGRSEVIAITVDAAASSESWIAFLDQLWGIRVAELSLSKTEDVRYPLRAYARLELLAPLSVTPGRELPRPPALALAADPFAPKVIPRPVASAEVPPGEPEPPPAPPPAPSLNLEGIRLNATVNTPEGRLVVLSDSGQDRILGVGERLRDFALKTIDSEGVLFESEAGVSGRVNFAKAAETTLGTPAPADVTTAAPAVVARKPGRLGIGVKAEGGGKEPAGLRVTQARPDAPEPRLGDLIVAINTLPTPTPEDAQRIMHTVFVNDAIDIALIRDGQALRVRIVAIE